jgi:hypothetical protein
MNQNLFEDAALDEAADAGEAWSEGFDEDEALVEGEGFDEDSFEDASGEAEGFDEDEAFAEGEAEGFEDEEAAFDDDEDAIDDSYDEGDPLEASDGFDDDFDDGESLDEEDDVAGHMMAGGHALDDDGDEFEEAFADAYDAADEDEFVRKLGFRMRARLRRAARPYLRRIAARTVPIGLQLIRHVSRMQSGGNGASNVDAMDAFADAAADAAMSRAQVSAYIPFLAGLAGRYVSRAILRASRRPVSPSATKAIGRSVMRATRKAAKAIVRKHGPKALRSVPRLVRQVVRVARQRPGAVRAMPKMIRRAGGRVAASRPAAARLSRPSATVRRVVARAGIKRRMGRSAARRRAGSPSVVRGGAGGTIHVHGPVRIVTRGLKPVTAARPL